MNRLACSKFIDQLAIDGEQLDNGSVYLQEVMSEVDDDQSSTLDFYEFVKVATIILTKKGMYYAGYLILKKLLYYYIIYSNILIFLAIMHNTYYV